MADPTDDEIERDARFLAFCARVGDPGGSMLAAGHVHPPRKESVTMADPTDEILRALATRSGEARLVADCGRVGFAVGDRCLTIDRIAAELLRLREALRSADELATAVAHEHDDDWMRTRLALAAYRAARGER